MRWKAGGRKGTGDNCLLVQEKRVGATLEDLGSVREVYCEVNASASAACRTLGNFLNRNGMQGRMIGV